MAIIDGNGTKTLKKLFIEKRIPLRKRPLVPVLADSNGVLGVYGIGADQRSSPDIGDEVLEIIIEETERI
jgi:tRNA(Ile)-lysidine synthase